MLGLYLGETRASPRRIRFTPPTEMFTLCHYTAQGPRELPIKAVYDMKVYTLTLWQHLSFQFFVILSLFYV